MINSEKILINIEKFEIYPSHEQIFNAILNKCEEEKKIIIRGVLQSGKSFFCRKLSIFLKEKLNLHDNDIKIIDLPLLILNNMFQNKMQDVSIKIINKFIKQNDLNELIHIQDFKIIILDDINDIIFKDLPKFRYNVKNNQILIQVLENKLYQINKTELQDLNYKVYELNSPNDQDLKIMIKKYNNIFNVNISVVDINFNKFKLLIA